VFHVSLLSKAPFDKYPQQELKEQPKLTLEDEPEFEIGRIVNIRKIRKSTKKLKYKYLVRWVGYNENNNLWQPLESLFNTQELVYQFHREKPDAPKPYNLKKLFEKGKKEGRH
jgi:hypothetical protein